MTSWTTLATITRAADAAAPVTSVAGAVTTTTGLILLTAVLQMWRRSLTASIRLLALQGVALSALVAAIGVAQGQTELFAASGLLLAVKGVLLPWTLTRTAARTGVVREQQPLINPTAGVLAAAALASLAYVVTQPIAALDPGGPARAAPVGMALVLIGFLVLLSRRTALAQLIGFVVLDNGIATVAFLTAGGVPLVVELGATLDVVLVVLVLRVLTARMNLTHGVSDLDDLTELHD
jgi:hydrogenase-4 component E